MLLHIGQRDNRERKLATLQAILSPLGRQTLTKQDIERIVKDVDAAYYIGSSPEVKDLAEKRSKIFDAWTALDPFEVTKGDDTSSMLRRERAARADAEARAIIDRLIRP